MCRPVTGRAVLLTHDNKAFSKVNDLSTYCWHSQNYGGIVLAQALTLNRLWKRMLTRWINVGGLTAAVYLLHRNDMI